MSVVDVKIIAFHSTDKSPRERAASDIADLLTDGYEIQSVTSNGNGHIVVILVKF